MAISNFIPTIWSETLNEELDNHYIAVAHCNRDFEGEIKNKGSVVKICGVGNIMVSDYTKNTNMSQPQSLSDTVKTLSIDQAKYFNFQIDDIDRAQSSPKLMNAAMKVAANSLAAAADQFVFDLFAQSQNAMSFPDVSVDNIIDCIIDARTRLYTNNVSDTEEVFLEVSPVIASLLLKAKVKLSTDNGETLERGCIGSIAGCKVFVSNHITTADTSDKLVSYCLMRTKRAVAFAEQLSEIEAYRPEMRFSDAVKGLHLYGAAIVYPEEFLTLAIHTDLV